MSSEWNQFQASIQHDIRVLGIEKFREFSAVVTTMYAGDSYWHIIGKYVPEDVKELIKRDLINDNDFYTLASQYYNMTMFKSLRDLDLLKLDSIIEFGGGVGGMAHLCRLLGYQGRYVIYDLPEVGQIQRHYLNSVGINNVELTTEIPSGKFNLFVGCWSISEASPRPELSSFPADDYWIAYQPAFDSIWNEQYFADRLENIKQVYAPHHPASKYLVGNLKKD